MNCEQGMISQLISMMFSGVWQFIGTLILLILIILFIGTAIDSLLESIVILVRGHYPCDKDDEDHEEEETDR